MQAHAAHPEYLKEKQKIDELINQGYLITKVTETLDGSFVEFKKRNTNQIEGLRIGNADARKYFSSVIIKQRKMI